MLRCHNKNGIVSPLLNIFIFLLHNSSMTRTYKIKVTNISFRWPLHTAIILKLFIDVKKRFDLGKVFNVKILTTWYHISYVVRYYCPFLLSDDMRRGVQGSNWLWYFPARWSCSGSLDTQMVVVGRGRWSYITCHWYELIHLIIRNWRTNWCRIGIRTTTGGVSGRTEQSRKDEDSILKVWQCRERMTVMMMLI